MIERRISINSRWVLFLFILVVCSTMIQSQVKEVVGKVTYVTDNEFYVDIGKSKGLIIDQRVDVLKDNSPFVSGVIIHISSNSAICTFEGEIAPVIGYTVRVVIKDSAKIPEIKEIKSDMMPDSADIKPEGVSTQSQISGNISYHISRAEGNNGNEYLRHNSLISVHGRNIYNTPFSVSVFGSLNGDAENFELNPQIHQVGLEYIQKEGLWQFSAGRMVGMTSGQTSRVDGIQVSRKIRSGVVKASVGSWENESGSKMYRGLLSINWKPNFLSGYTLNADITTQDNASGSESLASIYIRSNPAKKLSWMTVNTVNLSGNQGKQSAWRQATFGLQWQMTKRWFSTIHYNFDNYFTPITLNENKLESISINTRFQYSIRNYLSFSQSLYKNIDGYESQNSSVMAGYRGLFNKPLNLQASVDYLSSNFYETSRFYIHSDYYINKWQFKIADAVISQKFKTDESTQNINIVSFELSRKIGTRISTGIFTELNCSDGECSNHSTVNCLISF